MNINQELANFYKTEDLSPLLTIEEEHKLGTEVREGEPQQRDAAVDRLITSNLLLVLKIAQTYGNCLKGNGGLGVQDLVNEGNMGLMIAAKKYDPNKSKFSTYASFWIRQSMVRALCNKARVIRLPTNLVQKSIHVFKYIEKHKGEHEADPSPEQISEATSVKLSIVKRILRSNYQFLNLDSPISTQQGGGRPTTTIGDTVEDIANESPFKSAESKDNTTVINKVLDRLKPREKYIIEHRFGLNNKDLKTLEEIGKSHNVTRERIRQIEFDTMKKLRFALTKEYRV